MKIAEVCERTGLTRRTVRFYEEKGLISPETEYRNGREMREYSEEDIRLLKAVSVLRGLDISVEDIGLLIRREVTAEVLVSKYRSDIRAELVKTENIYNILSSLEAGSSDDIYSLAAQAESKAEGRKLPLRDAEPDFSGLEELTEEEKRQSFERFHNELVKKNAVSDYKAKILKRILILLASAVVVFLIIFGISWIPKSIEVTARGYTYSDKTGKRYEDTLTVKGKIYEPLFFVHTFSGEISLENTPELNYNVSKEIMLNINEDDYSRNIDEPCVRVYSDSVSYYLYITDPDRPNTTMMIEGFEPGGKLSYICKFWDENDHLIYDHVFEEN